MRNPSEILSKGFCGDSLRVTLLLDKACNAALCGQNLPLSVLFHLHVGKFLPVLDKAAVVIS